MPVVQAGAEPFEARLPARWVRPILSEFCLDACRVPLTVVEEGPAKVVGYLDMALTDAVTARAAFVVSAGELPSCSVVEVRGMVWGEPVGMDDTDQAEDFVSRLSDGLRSLLEERTPAPAAEGERQLVLIPS